MRYTYYDESDHERDRFSIVKVYEGIVGGTVEVGSFDNEQDAQDYCNWKNGE